MPKTENMVAIKSLSEKKASLQLSKSVSIETYFKLEDKSLTKNEYDNGIIIPRAGGKLPHNALASRACFELQYQVMLKQLDYLVANSDTKIRIETFNKIVYPDAVVICETPQYYNNRLDTICNPLLVVEVLSASTQKYDKSTKFEMYRTLESFKQYILIYQDRPYVSVWTKQDDGSWMPKDYIGLDQTALLPILMDCLIPLARLYKGILPTPSQC